MKKEILLKQLVAKGAKQLPFLDMQVEALDDTALHSGDVFTIPENWREFIINEVIRICPEYTASAMCIIFETEQLRAVKFYPSTLWKRVKTNSGEYVTSNGSFVHFTQRYDCLDDALDDAVGHKIVVNVRKVETIFKGEPRMTNVYTYDFYQKERIFKR